MKCVATCAFGVETALKMEMREEDFTVTRSENGKFYFETDLAGMIHANMALRTADRIFVVLGEAEVKSYDDLFDAVLRWDLAAYLGVEGRYLVQAKSVKSMLYSLRDIQAVGKKALIENLRSSTGKQVFAETAESYPLMFTLVNDHVELWLDTSGEALHKRGYRLKQGEAPIKETLAATLIILSFFSEERVMYDPFCGSGTLAIEAAMIAKKMAPNLNRAFAFDHFPWVDAATRRQVRGRLLKRIDQNVTTRIYASDLDLQLLQCAQENAEAANVDDCIHFQRADYAMRSYDEPYGIIITNPPYGERLETQKEAEILYQGIAKLYRTLDTFSLFMISAYPGIEGIIGKKANRTRVLFNGNIKSRYYQYFGPRPPLGVAVKKS